MTKHKKERRNDQKTPQQKKEALHDLLKKDNVTIEELDKLLQSGHKIINDARRKGIVSSDLPDYEGNTLYYAVKTNNADIVNWALGNGCQIINDASLIDKRPYFEGCSLHQALSADEPNPKIIQTLLQHGAQVVNLAYSNDPNAGQTRIYHYDSLYLAYKSDNQTIIDLTLTYGADPKTLKDNESQQKMLERKNELIEISKLRTVATIFNKAIITGREPISPLIDMIPTILQMSSSLPQQQKGNIISNSFKPLEAELLNNAQQQRAL
jgi:hypothetical protein